MWFSRKWCQTPLRRANELLTTINLTANCLHDCVHCYVRGDRNYLSECWVILYEVGKAAT